MAILQAVLQKLSRKTITEEPPLSDSINNLADRINRYSPLFALQEQRQLIEVQSKSTGETYQSMILAIDLVSGQLQIDELFPLPQQNYNAGDTLTIKHHHNGRVLSFDSTLLSTDFQTDGTIYTLELPQSVAYRQRRRAPRIAMSQQQPLTVRLQSPWRSPWYAIARNLSVGGMRLTIGGNVLEQLRHGAILPLCEFQFGADINIRCQGIIRSYRFIRRPYRHTELSIEFVDMAPSQRLQLQTILNALNDTPEAA